MSTAMSLLAGLASDLAAIVLLAYAVYFRRYHRRGPAAPGNPPQPLASHAAALLRTLAPASGYLLTS
jgi:hypothetical protein